MSKTFTYKSKDREKESYEIDDKLHHQYKQALTDYTTSKDFIYTHYIHLWNKSLKSYYLHMGDRESYIKDWQSNYSLGLIRSSIDTYTGFLTDTPLQFNVTAIDDLAHEVVRDGKTSLDFISDAVTYIADVTKFNEQLALGLIEGVTLGTYIFKTSQYITPDKEVKYISIIDDIPQDVVIKKTGVNLPITKSIDPYHIFPDFGNERNPSYVFERNVISISEFLKTFIPLIQRNENTIKWKGDELAYLLTNRNGADFSDYGRIRDDIFAAQNLKYSKTCSIYKTGTGYEISQTKDSKNNVEFIFGVYEDRIVLIANNYPIYIGENIYGMIPYKIGSMYPTRGLISEGLPYLLFGMEDIQNSFYNNMVDGARATAIPRWIANRNAFSTNTNIRDIPPGGLLWVDNADTESALRVLPSPSLNDGGMMNTSDYYSQKLSGVSEINQGFASKVRTAAEAGALVESTNKRLNQYLKRFANYVGSVGEDWIAFSRMFWTEKQFGYVKDIDGVQRPMSFTNADLKGSCYISLDSSGLFAMNKEMDLKKKMDMFSRFSPYFEPEQNKEFIRDIFRSANMNPNVYMPKEAKLKDPQIKPGDNQLAGMFSSTVDENAQDMTAAMTNQLDLGNGGNGRG